MYYSLTSIDIVAAGCYFQTDHRDADEMAREPEISTLFAFARLLNARNHATQHAKEPIRIVYGANGRPIRCVIEAIAACGALLGPSPDSPEEEVTTDATPSALIDEAFTMLAERVLTISGESDFESALRWLEADIASDPPSQEDDEGQYWTRVLWLSALTGECLRERIGGRWVAFDKQAELPFAFEDGDNLMLPTNRASRFIEDGPSESMFRLLEHVDAGTELPAPGEGLTLPSLRSRTEAEATNLIFRPLFDHLTDPELPVIAYGTDTPMTFGMLLADKHEYSDELHARALANLADQQVTIEELDVAGVQISAVSGGFYATEKILDVAFMQSLHAKHGELLAAIVPTRGMLFVTSAAPDDPNLTMRALTVIADNEAKGSRRISKAILIVRDGQVVGQVKIEQEAPPPAKKPGWFGRLLGRN